MRRDVKFVPFLEALEERRVLSSNKLTMPQHSAAELRSDAAVEKTHTPPGQAVAALHRNNTHKDVEKNVERPVETVQPLPNTAAQAGPKAASSTVPNTTAQAASKAASSTVPNTVAQAVSKAASSAVSNTVAQTVARLDVVESLRPVVLAADVAQAVVGNIDFVPPSLSEFAAPTTIDVQAGPMDAQPMEAQMLELDLRPGNRGVFFTPLVAGLQASPLETGALVPPVAAAAGNHLVAGRALPSRFEWHFEIDSAADAFDEIALALMPPLISNVDVLSRSVRLFLDQLDDLADEMGCSLADSSYANWCVVLGAGLAGGELARRLWKRQQQRSARDREDADGSSWAPGLPSSFSTELA